MELGGEEKKIQALFSELKTADERIAPRFRTTWNRAQAAPRRIRAFNLAFVGVTALLVCTLIGLAIWSRYSQPSQTNVANLKIESSPQPKSPAKDINSLPANVTPIAGSEMPNRTPGEKAKPRNTRLTAHHKALLAANRKLRREAKAITDWQSPTTELLSSASDDVFSSLPELDKSVSDLKSFLPNRPN